MESSTLTSKSVPSFAVGIRCGAALGLGGRCKRILGYAWPGGQGRLMVQGWTTGFMSGAIGPTPEGYIDREAHESSRTFRCASTCGANYSKRNETLRGLHDEARARGREIWLAEV